MTTAECNDRKLLHTAAIQDANNSLRRLERQDWWRWGMMVTVTLLLSFGIFALSLPQLKRSFPDQAQLDLSVAGLCGMVLLFDVFSVYQQLIIMRLRRQLAAQIGMMVTLEMLKPDAQQASAPPPRAREFQRFHLDQRVAVNATVDGEKVTIYGRTTDISDGGVGTVIAAPLQLGAEVILEINLGAQSKLVIPSIVRHRQGFRHGFEFRNVTPSQLEAIQRACDGALPFFGQTLPTAGLQHSAGQVRVVE